MSSTGNDQQEHFNLGVLSGTPTLNKFYTKIHDLSCTRQQQAEIELDIPELESNDQLKPCEIGSLAGNVESADILAKNLLDSFALIFARPGPKGVVATAIKRTNEEHDTYTLLVARNGERNSSFSITEEINNWFTDREDDVNIPKPQNRLWSHILQTYRLSISEDIKKVGLSKEKIVDIQRDIKVLIQEETSLPGQCVSPEISRSILEILDSLSTFFSIEPMVSISQRKKEINPEFIKLLDTVTRQCFLLLESHENETRALLEKWILKEEAHSRSKLRLDKLRQIMYTIANYRRAWYDIVRFKINLGSATLRIKLLPRSTGSSRVEDIEIQREIPKGEDDQESSSAYQNPDNDMSHCEMKILGFLLGDDSASDFFSYIGCSKGPCWLCYHTLKYMAPAFKMRKSHLKLYASWRVPQFQEGEKDQKRFSKVLHLLDKEITRQLEQTVQESRKRDVRMADVIDMESTFLSPRTESMRRLEGN
ncbi:hypothetical protein M434DRAFT_26996 [Hypoxylon sp. CO27-5]|nr:hypothetical protein M434DRAFT_26996 [Hypoxylon sp. CO27-5]